MLTLSNVMASSDNFFADHFEDKKHEVLAGRYDSIESSIIYLRKELENKGHDITAIVKSNNLTVIHSLYGYEKIEQFIKCFEADLKDMEILRDFMSDTLGTKELIA